MDLFSYLAGVASTVAFIFVVIAAKNGAKYTGGLVKTWLGDAGSDTKAAVDDIKARLEKIEAAKTPAQPATAATAPMPQATAAAAPVAGA